MALLEFLPLRHMPAQQVRFTREFHLPAPYALRVCVPSRRFAPCQPAAGDLRLRPRIAPDDGPSTAQHPWGSPFRVLLLPARGTPLGASPLLPFPGPARTRFRRGSRGFSVSAIPRGTRRSGTARITSGKGNDQSQRPIASSA